MLPVSIDMPHLRQHAAPQGRQGATKLSEFEVVFGQAAERAVPEGSGSETDLPVQPPEVVPSPEAGDDPEGEPVAAVSAQPSNAEKIPAGTEERVTGQSVPTEPFLGARRSDPAAAPGGQKAVGVEHLPAPSEPAGMDRPHQKSAAQDAGGERARQDARTPPSQDPPSLPAARAAPTQAPTGDSPRSSRLVETDLAAEAAVAPDAWARTPVETGAKAAATNSAAPQGVLAANGNTGAITETSLDAGLRGDTGQAGMPDSPGLHEPGPRQIGPAAGGSAVAPAQATETARSVAAQLSDAVQRQGEGRFELSLNPEELGRVKLSMRPTETGLVVTLLTERAETQDLMRRHMDQLAEEFSRIGYGEVAFDFGSGGGDPSERPKEHLCPSGQSSESGNHTGGERSPNAMPGGLDMRL